MKETRTKIPDYVTTAKNAATGSESVLNDLLYCPFCGAPSSETGNDENGYTVTCWDCEIDGPVKDDRESANKAWNTRAI